MVCRFEKWAYLSAKMYSSSDMGIEPNYSEARASNLRTARIPIHEQKAQVLEVDIEKQRLKLGMKQLVPASRSTSQNAKKAMWSRAA